MEKDESGKRLVLTSDRICGVLRYNALEPEQPFAKAIPVDTVVIPIDL